MNINGFHLHLTNDDIGKLVQRYAKGAIDSIVLHDGSFTIRGRRDGSKKFMARISVRVVANEIRIVVEDADVDGVFWGFQEYGVSMAIDSALKHIPGAKSGGRTESILPVSGLCSILSKELGFTDVSVGSLALTLSRGGVDIAIA